MGRISILEFSLFILGLILIISAGFTSGNVPPIGFWGLYGNYILLIGGSMLIILAVVLTLRKSK